MKVTSEEQQALLKLADTDEEIRLLEHRRSNLEEQKVLDSHVETEQRVTAELVEASKTKDNLSAQSTRHEREIDTVEAARKTSDANIYSGRVTDQKSLDALREEVRAMGRRKSDLEDSLLEIMEQLEEVTELTDDLTRRRKELRAQIEDLTQRRDEAARDIDAELRQIRQRREQEAADANPEALQAYNQLRAKRNGRVVARLAGRTCTGCQLELTAIELEEIKETAGAGQLAYCQQCGSIIIPS